jgi:methylphosphonate synthase
MKGELLRGLLNDLKRRPEDAAKELEISIELLNDILEGKTPLPHDIEQKVYQCWPIAPRDLASINDDCPDGVIIVSAEQSKNSSRVMDRAGKPYYEYRDTAMSQCSNYRPEWIKELCEVEDNDPENKNVQWNNGHFMHQFTYFIGPVNFYYLDENKKKQVAVMNTGDSMYITPFVPHTFTTRKNEGGEGLILAVTYGSFLSGDARFELGAIGRDKSSSLILRTDARAQMYADQLSYFMNSLSATTEFVAKYSGLSVETINNHLSANKLPSIDEIQKVAAALKVNLRDIYPHDEKQDKVVVQMHNEARSWSSEQNNYHYVELASSLSMPNSKSLEVTVEAAHDEYIEAPLHQFFYNTGQSKIEMKWLGKDGEHKTGTINPGDSFYSKPNTKICLTGPGKGLIVRIPGRVSSDAIRELSYIGHKNLNRVIKESMQWFDPKGKH